MKQLTYQVRFTTPAFLGNAEQSGQWRTPPFKALLRQWWRVAYAADKEFQVNLAEMRREEGLLFGNAWLSHYEGDREVTDYRKSLVRIRLDKWTPGVLDKKAWGHQELDKVNAGANHPEVGKIGPKLYLGYGPLVVEKVQRAGRKPEYATVLKNNTAIQSGETAILAVAFPTTHSDPQLKRLLEANGPRLQQALWLMDRYGTLGGRSRNGWGSFDLLPLSLEEGRGKGTALAGATPLRDWNQALAWDWPHAIGRDNNGPLVWLTAMAYDDWKVLMRDLAILKIGLRTQFVIPNVQPPHFNPLERHWLSYPITRHSTKAWKGSMRLPNSLRFKVRPDASDPTKLRGVIFQVPCLPPPEFKPDRIAIIETWQAVHALIDELAKPANTRGYESISKAERRAALKPQLDSVTLQRISE